MMGADMGRPLTTLDLLAICFRQASLTVALKAEPLTFGRRDYPATNRAKKTQSSHIQSNEPTTYRLSMTDIMLFTTRAQ